MRRKRYEVIKLNWEKIISIVSMCAAVVFGCIAYLRNKAKDEADDGRSNGTILTELGYIKGGIDDVKTEQREQRKTNTELVSRLTAVEASAKQAHKRIDGLEARRE